MSLCNLENNRKRIVALYFIVFFILDVSLIISLHRSLTWSITIKNTVVSLYYLIFLSLEQWNGLVAAFSLAIGLFAGWCIPIKCVDKGKNIIVILCLNCFVLYFPILCWVYAFQVIPHGSYQNIIHCEYIVIQFINGLLITNYLKQNQAVWLEKKDIGIDHNKIVKRGTYFVLFMLVFTIIPILLVGKYAFPQSDDFSFGYHCHIAWKNTHSILAVFRAAVVMILEAYFEWQGTFSSIFLMSIQPTVFGKNMYFIVPYIMIFFLMVSSWFLYKTVFVNYLKTKNIVYFLLGMYLTLIIQYIPSKASAFFWFNGAAHYIIAHSVAIILFAVLFRILLLDYSIWDLIIGIMAALYVGGTNYVTTVNVLFVLISIMCCSFIFKKIKIYSAAWGIIISYLCSFTLNIVAPGNYMKMGNITAGAGFFNSFLLAFFDASKYALDSFSHWSVCIYLLVLIPIFWVGLRNCSFSFSYPLVFVLYSWCFMASMFYMPLFTINNIEVGRFKNIIYCMWILWITFDWAYLLGWIQRRKEFQNFTIGPKFMNYYLVVCGLVFCLFSALTFAAEPKKNTTFYSLKALNDSDVKLCYDIYSYDVDVMENAKNRTAVIYDLKNPTGLFVDPSIEKWTSGLRIFFEIDNLEILPYQGEIMN